MALRNWNLEWLNHNSQRSYPLTDDATAKDLTNTFKLPNDFIVAIYLTVHAGLDVDPDNFLIKSIGNFATGFNVVIGFDNGSEILPVATALIAREGHTRNLAYRLGGVGDFVDATGHLVIGILDNIDNQPSGTFNFDIDGGRLETDVVRPMIRGVSSLQVQNGTDISERIYGDIVLRAGRNMRITPVLVGEQDPILVFDAIEGEGLNEDCVCEGETEATPILSINGISPTPDGNFKLIGNDCLEIEDIQNGIRAKDVCSDPCCGCDELEVITNQLEGFGRSVATLETLLVNLDARVTTMDQVVLGSRLGDRGCTTCPE